MAILGTMTPHANKRVYVDVEITGTQVLTLTDMKAEYAQRILHANVVQLESLSAEVLKSLWYTVVVAADAKSLTVYSWKPTAVADVTPLASTASTTIRVAVDLEVS